MDKMLSNWREEQLQIASKACIIADDNSQLKRCRGSSEEFSTCTYSIKEKLIGGVDVSFGDDPQSDQAIAVYVVTRNHQVIYQDSMVFTLSQPYVSSYLAFREIEPLQTLIHRQKTEYPDMTPEVILVDGNGILHERRAGLATFVGVRTSIPTIGVGKTLYCTDGLHVDLVEEGVASKLAQLVEYLEPRDDSMSTDDPCRQALCIICHAPIAPYEKSTNVNSNSVKEEVKKPSMTGLIRAISGQCEGFAIPLKGMSGDILAAVLVGHGGKITKKKQSGTKIPIYVSVGHAISLQEAICICSSLSLARIPEPIRQADLIGRDIIKRQLNL